MQQAVLNRITRAKDLIATTKHISLATVNADRSPHNTPLFFILTPTLDKLYWFSSPNSLHSQNIQRSGQIFAVIFDMTDGGGLYIQSNDARELAGNELQHALNAYNKVRSAADKRQLTINHYSGKSTQRIYGATPQSFWVNASIKDAQGHILQDNRYLISKEQLLS